MDALQLFFDFRGRISRTRYWGGLATLFLGVPIIGGIIAIAIYFLIMSGSDPNESIERSVITLVVLACVAMIIGIALNIGAMALTAKRLHDLDTSGLWCLLYLIAPSPLAAMFMAGSQLIRNEPAVGLGAVFGFFGGAVIVAMVILGCLPTKPGPNQYDYPPSPLPQTPPQMPPEPQPLQPQAFQHLQTQAAAPAQPAGFGKRPQR